MYNNSSGRCTSVKFLSWNWLQSVICFPDPRFAGLAFNLAAGSDLLVYMSMPARRRDQGDEIHPLSSLQANGYVALSCWLWCPGQDLSAGSRANAPMLQTHALLPPPPINRLLRLCYGRFRPRASINPLATTAYHRSLHLCVSRPVA